MKSETGGYGIRSVTRLTGLPAHTLRLWEERYGALTVARSPGGHRIYSAANLERLERLNRLIAQGHRISDLAALTDQELDARLSREAAPSTGLAAPQRVAVFGESLPQEMRDAGLERHLHIVDRNWIRFVRACDADKPDAILLELPEFTTDDVAAIRGLIENCPGARVAACFYFARQADLSALHDAGVKTLQAPASAADLWWLLRQPDHPIDQTTDMPASLPVSDSEAPAPRRFSPSQLAKLATHSSDVVCECPAHLVQLVNSLSAFESYSASCEHTSPDDAALHALLHRETARARAIMEKALLQVARAEGIEYD
jgi:DNA-binding transcriptional MerR regulator